MGTSHMRKLLLTVFTFFCTTAPAEAATTAPQQDALVNQVTSRIARIQQELQAREESPKVLDNIRITQWVNFPNWPNWNNWNDWNNNWNNWYNY